jgi:hypothetical protein
MVIFDRHVSWSNFDIALTCPRKLQYTLEKRPTSIPTSSYWTVLGKVVQRVWEVYFANDVNLKKDGCTDLVVERVMARVLDHSSVKGREIPSVPGKTADDFWAECVSLVLTGLKAVRASGMMPLKIASEQRWRSVFKGFPMSCRMDFVHFDEDRKETQLWDGKAHTKKNANPNQLRFYALALYSAGWRTRHGGFLYWRHGFEEVDLTPSGLRDFVERDFARGRQIFQDLRQAQTLLEATPSKAKCNRCLWRNNCPDSAYFRKDNPMVAKAGTVEVDMGGVLTEVVPVQTDGFG